MQQIMINTWKRKISRENVDTKKGEASRIIGHTIAFRADFSAKP